MNLSFKSILALAALTPMMSSASSAPSQPQSGKTGIFRDMKSYESRTLSRKACIKSGGVYNKATKICQLEDGGSTIEITQSESGKYNLNIFSIGKDTVTCGYEGTAEEYGSQIISKDSSDSDSCEITVSYQSENEISVGTKGSCQEYCGYGMSLNIESAQRTK